MVKRFLIALQFLTIIPLRRSLTSDVRELGRSSSAYPLVGLVIGAALAISAAVLGQLVPPAVLAALLLMLQVGLNGALHIDGLSDTFDAIAVRGGRERKLSAMKDGTAGPAGIAAVVLVLILKFSLIYSIAVLYPGVLPFALLSGPILSRWALVVSMLSGKLAADEGLGKIFVDATGPREFAVATIAAFALITLGAAGLGGSTPNPHMLNALCLFVVYLFVRVLDKVFTKQFGGISGDTMGAEVELVEALYLVMVVIWTGLYI